MKTIGDFKDWVPILSKLVWPIFILIILLVYRTEVTVILKSIKDEGRSIKVAGWLEIGERANSMEIKKFQNNDISINAVQGSEYILEKGSVELLQSVIEKLKKAQIQRIDILVISTEHSGYSAKVLVNYVNLIGIKHIVFLKNKRFDGWINSGIFTAQLIQHKTYTYEELKANIIGVNMTSIKLNESARITLEKMQNENIEEIAVVDPDNTFKFMTSRSAILSKLMTSVILNDSLSIKQ